MSIMYRYRLWDQRWKLIAHFSYKALNVPIAPRLGLPFGAARVRGMSVVEQTPIYCLSGCYNEEITASDIKPPSRSLSRATDEIKY